MLHERFLSWVHMLVLEIIGFREQQGRLQHSIECTFAANSIDTFTANSKVLRFIRNYGW